MTPSKQSSAKRSSSTSTLTRCIGSLWCALNAHTKIIFKKLNLRQKIMCTSINKAGYDHLRMENSNMQSLILFLKDLKEKSSSDLTLMQIWKALNLGLLQPLRWSSLTKLPCIEYFGNADQYTSSQGKGFVRRIAILKRGSLYR